MKRKPLLLAFAAAALLSSAALAPAFAQQGRGPGMMMGQGQGMGMSGMRGMGMSGMRGMSGMHGMSGMGMMGHGHGKGMMMGGGKGRMGMMHRMHKKMMAHKGFAREKKLSADDVRRVVDGRLAMNGFSGLKAGKTKLVDENAVLTDVVSAKGDLAFRVKVDRATGAATIVE